MDHRNVMACVTQQKTCKRLIKVAAEIKKEFGGKLFVVHVARSNSNFLDNAKESEALGYLFDISKASGANLSVLKSDDIINALSNFINKKRINIVVMGKSPDKENRNRFVKDLKELVGEDVEIRVIN